MDHLVKKLLQASEEPSGDLEKPFREFLQKWGPETFKTRRWSSILEKMSSNLTDEEVSSIVTELVATTQFPTAEDYEKHSATKESFLLDAPNPGTEIIDPGGFPMGEPRPYDHWDIEEPDSMEPRRPKTRSRPK